MSISVKSFLTALILISFNALALNGQPYPKTPDLTMTPGKLCSSPDAKRYPEQIAYCNRNVDTYMKGDVINKYDQELGYSVRSMNRNDFKIDHLIPLCAGGDNHEDNLWPQHKSVYNITDPVEPLVCDKMAQGKLKQEDAVKLIIFAKTHLDQVPAVIQKLNSL